jgi:hypothetical protein
MNKELWDKQRKDSIFWDVGPDYCIEMCLNKNLYSYEDYLKYDGTIGCYTYSQKRRKDGSRSLIYLSREKEKEFGIKFSNYGYACTKEEFDKVYQQFVSAAIKDAKVETVKTPTELKKILCQKIDKLGPLY